VPKLKTLLRIVRALSRQPRCLTRVIDDEADYRDAVIKRYGCARGLPTIDYLDLLPDLEETIEPCSALDSDTLPTDYALLKGLARSRGLRSYFEIGTWRGESVAIVAKVTDECVSVRLSDAEMRQKGLSEEFIRVHGFFSNQLKNVTHVCKDSLSLDYGPFMNSFDLVFVDGHHAYESVKSDTRNAFKLLRNDRSVIVWHDYGYSPECIRWSVLAGILDGCPEDKRHQLYHVSNTKCAVYLQDTFATHFSQYPGMPNKVFKITVSATKSA
jgi:predicted O-methyltransferase YrrM